MSSREPPPCFTGDSSMVVYFDDFRVEHIKSPVISSQDYFPFGLSFNSYSRENSLNNQYHYNGKEQQDELDLGWLDYGARMYMADIGRWGVIDPLASVARRWSPYVYAYDNPVRFIDPDGMYSTEEWKKDNGVTDDDLITVYQAPKEQTDPPKGEDEPDPNKPDAKDPEPYTNDGFPKFDDKQGKLLYDHWKNGKGAELFLDSEEWAKYMRDDEVLNALIGKEMEKRYGAAFDGSVIGRMHGETKENSYRTGYGLLNGSNRDVGDLEYLGVAIPNANGTTTFNLTFTWHDKMDPNSNYFWDKVGAAVFPGTSYNVHITWSATITIKNLPPPTTVKRNIR